MLKINNLEEIVEKIMPLGITRAAIRYYGLPLWWYKEWEESPYWIARGAEFLATRFYLYLPSLLDNSWKAQSKRASLDEGDDLRKNLAIYTGDLLVKGLRRFLNEEIFYFRPSESLAIFQPLQYPHPEITKVLLPFGVGKDFNFNGGQVEDFDGIKYRRESLDSQFNYHILSNDELHFLRKVFGGSYNVD